VATSSTITIINKIQRLNFIVQPHLWRRGDGDGIESAGKHRVIDEMTSVSGPLGPKQRHSFRTNRSNATFRPSVGYRVSISVRASNLLLTVCFPGC
jgi:hypothetical protein